MNVDEILSAGLPRRTWVKRRSMKGEIDFKFGFNEVGGIADNREEVVEELS